MDHPPWLGAGGTSEDEEDAQAGRLLETSKGDRSTYRETGSNETEGRGISANERWKGMGKDGAS